MKYFKEDEEGRQVMCEAVEKYAKKYAEKQYDSGKIEGKIDAVRELMKNLKWSAEQAMESVGIPKSEYSKYMKIL